MTDEVIAKSSHRLGAGGADAPTLDQFLALSQKVEELEDRVRSLAVNDVDRLRAQVAANQETIRKLKSPRQWGRALWRRVRRGFRA